MTKYYFQRLATSLIAALLMLTLAGCSGLKADIPKEVVTAAVTRQAQQEQMALWQQLAPNQTGDRPQISVKRVKVKQVQRVKVVNDIAYEVTGTYSYKLRYAQRSPIKQSQVPFSLILQGGNEAQSWRLLLTDGDPQTRRNWRWQPLAQSLANS